MVSRISWPVKVTAAIIVILAALYFLQEATRIVHVWCPPDGTCRPGWITKAIIERQDSQSRDVIEESTYKGKTAFLLIRGDRADTGDEHILFSEDGKEICQFGGFVGRVTSGECDLDQIMYVRTLYPRRSD